MANGSRVWQNFQAKISILFYSSWLNWACGKTFVILVTLFGRVLGSSVATQMEPQKRPRVYVIGA